MTAAGATPSGPPPWKPAVLTLALLSALGFGFFACFEQRTDEVELPPRGEALRNPYLAAQRLLAATGAPVQSFERLGALPWPPPARATLILPSQRRTLSSERSAEIVAWVERGGHLVVVTPDVWDDLDRTEDPILDPLGLQQFVWESSSSEAAEDLGSDEEDFDEEDSDPENPDEEEAEPEEAAPEDFETDAESAEAEPVDTEPADAETDTAESPDEPADLDAIALAELPDRPTPLRVEFNPYFYWLDTEGRASWSISDVNGMHLAQLPIGEGRITALTDAEFLTNDQIGELDHAELLYRLAAPAQDATEQSLGPVWIVLGDSFATPWQIVWKYGWRVLIGLAVLVAAWLLTASQRLGPQLPDPTLRRRSLMEHVDASGRFLWRHGARGQLLEAERRALLDRVRERHPGWSRLPAAELHDRLAQGAGLPVESVARALAVEDELPPEAFVATVRTLHRITSSV